MKSLRMLCLLMCGLALPSAFGLGLAEITYPVFLPYNQGDQKIDVRPLPFATRLAHPEFIGPALSARYLVPNDDSADLPKDINMISACGVRIATSVGKDGSRGKRVSIALKVDLNNYVKPDYLPFTDAKIISSIAQAITATLEKNGCDLGTIEVEAGEKHSKLKKQLEELLRTKEGEPGAAGQPATPPRVGD